MCRHERFLAFFDGDSRLWMVQPCRVEGGGNWLLEDPAPVLSPKMCRSEEVFDRLDCVPV